MIKKLYITFKVSKVEEYNLGTYITKIDYITKEIKSKEDIDHLLRYGWEIDSQHIIELENKNDLP